MFDKSFDRVIGHEGAFQNDRRDRGNWTSGKIGVGELKGTKYGISAMAYPDLDIKNLTVEQAKAIYKRDWWDKLGMDKFHPAMSFQMFDASINHGIHNATRILQRAVGTKDDGVIGNQTLQSVKKMDLNDLLMSFLSHRLRFMTDISTFDTYGRGWSRRIADNLLLATKDNDM
jgi:lysozyme family protein